MGVLNIEQTRRHVSSTTDADRKSKFGQYLTPLSIARFMASLFPPSEITECHLLDPGAGIGSLSAAFLERWKVGNFGFKHVAVDAFEIDDELLDALGETLSQYDVDGTIHTVDFIETAVESMHGNLFQKSLPKYSHAILNPPYKKINSHSLHRTTLRQVGIETVNLYSAFVALSLGLLAPHGQLVAIIPRSFCNGPYYKPFRQYIFSHAALHRIHLFNSRDKAFKEDSVLQENVIIHLERDGRQKSVTVSTSSDGRFEDLEEKTYPFKRIVPPDDAEQFIHIPTSRRRNIIESCPEIRHTLSDIGIQVSTGPVVDFRLREHIREMPETDSMPLLYPGHFKGRKMEWPKPDFKKPNAIQYNRETEKWFYPNGYYTVVRRFSTKEEKRRIVANVVNPKDFPGKPVLGFENHLNVFHDNKHGLCETFARGLAVFLNTTAIDMYFRSFNGHTQVNATDLRLIRYPSREILLGLGEWSMRSNELTQDQIDEQLRKVIECPE